MKKLLSLLLAAIMLLGMAGIAAADEINYDVTEPTKVVFWHTLNDEDDAALLERIIKEFEAEHPLITIEPVYYASYNKVNEALAAANVANVDVPGCAFINVPRLKAYADNGVIENLDPYIAHYGVDMSDFVQGFLDAMQVDGHQVAFPVMQSGQVAYYNADLLEQLGIDKINGALLDLGVSSHQLDDAARGFSYMHDAPLDMRMDRTAYLTARQVVNEWSCEELRRILFEYGEERYAPAIAKRIVQCRAQKPIETTLELVDIIRAAMPPQALREKQHPAKRSFQAIRIAVNGELDALAPMLNAAAAHLRPGGRLAVISFHSLEDRIIKKTMQELATGCTCPPEFPVCVCGKKPKLRLVSRKPIVSTDEELERNPRARSAKLRVAEKL